jgi:hypothetical protein
MNLLKNPKFKKLIDNPDIYWVDLPIIDGNLDYTYSVLNSEDFLKKFENGYYKYTYFTNDRREDYNEIQTDLPSLRTKLQQFFVDDNNCLIYVEMNNTNYILYMLGK